MAINIYCINLKSRPDKRKFIQNHFSKIPNIKVTFVPAIKHQYGWIGCSLSHLKIVNKFMKANEYLIVIEDDCLINNINNFGKRLNVLLQWLRKHNNKWEIFNGNPTTINKSYFRVMDKHLKIVGIRGLTTNFIIYNTSNPNNIIKKMERYKNYLKKNMNNLKKEKLVRYPVDSFIYLNFKCITCLPYLTTQRPTVSDIRKRKVNYSTVIRESEMQLTKLYNKYIS